MCLKINVTEFESSEVITDCRREKEFQTIVLIGGGTVAVANNLNATKSE